MARNHLIMLIAFSGAFLLGVAQRVIAVDRQWAQPVNGSFSTAANWSPNGVPGSADNAVFNIDGTYSVGVAIPITVGTLVARRGEVSLVDSATGGLTLNGDPFTSLGLIVGQGAGDNALLTIFDSSAVPNGLSVTSLVDGVVGQATASAGTLNIASRRGVRLRNIDIGQSGSGTLNISSGGSLVASTVTIGKNANGVGIVTVGGGDFEEMSSTLTVNEFLTVGDLGGALIDIRNRGVVNTPGGAKVGGIFNYQFEWPYASRPRISSGGQWHSGSLEIAVNGTGGGLVVDANGQLTATNISVTSETLEVSGSVADFGKTTIGVPNSTTYSELKIWPGGNVESSSAEVFGHATVGFYFDTAGKTQPAVWTVENTLNLSNGFIHIGAGGEVNSIGGNVYDYDIPHVGPGYIAVTIRGSSLDSGRWRSRGNIQIGDNDRPGSVKIIPNGELIQDWYEVRVGGKGRLLLHGGTLSIPTPEQLVVEPGGIFEFTAGMLKLHSYPWDGDGASLPGEPFGRLVTIPRSKGLHVSSATLTSPVIVDGGVFSTGRLSNGELLDLRSGRLIISLDSFFVGRHPGDSVHFAYGHPLSFPRDSTLGGIRLDLQPEVTIAANRIVNNGVILGSGRVEGGLLNYAEVRADSGTSIVVDGIEINENRGRLSLLGGFLEFTRQLINYEEGTITGRGTVVLRDEMQNRGRVLLSGGFTDFHGVIRQEGDGRLIVAGGGLATFFDEFVHNGAELRVAADSTATFFGDVTGTGSYTGTGTIQFEGSFFPGNSPGTVTFGGDVVFGAASLLEMELSGIEPGGQHDQLLLEGAADLGGSLSISLVDGFLPEPGDAFVLMRYGQRSGEFDTVRFPDALAGMPWVLDYSTHELILTFGLAGDLNSDGTVDRADASVLATNFGAASDATWSMGDFNRDGRVTIADLAILQRNFNQMAERVEAQAVPEPSGFVSIVGELIAFGVWLSRGQKMPRRMAHGC